MVAKELLAFLIAHNLARCVMAQAAQAQQRLEAGHVPGKIVLQIH